MPTIMRPITAKRIAIIFLAVIFSLNTRALSIAVAAIVPPFKLGKKITLGITPDK